jgi:hypothetical protein
VGNAHLRRVLVEAAWSYSRRNTTGPTITKRRQGCPVPVVQIARRAQDRLHQRYWRLTQRNKLRSVAVVAVPRELAGFVLGDRTARSEPVTSDDHADHRQLARTDGRVLDLEAKQRSGASSTPLAHAQRGVAAGSVWLSDYGIQLSRDFER